MTNVVEKEKTSKISTSPLTESRLTLLEKNVMIELIVNNQRIRIYPEFDIENPDLDDKPYEGYVL